MSAGPLSRSRRPAAADRSSGAAANRGGRNTCQRRHSRRETRRQPRLPPSASARLSRLRSPLHLPPEVMLRTQPQQQRSRATLRFQWCLCLPARAAACCLPNGVCPVAAAPCVCYHHRAWASLLCGSGHGAIVASQACLGPGALRWDSQRGGAPACRAPGHQPSSPHPRVKHWETPEGKNWWGSSLTARAMTVGVMRSNPATHGRPGGTRATTPVPCCTAVTRRPGGRAPCWGE